MLGPVAQSVAGPIADPEVVSSILGRPHTFVDIAYGHSPPSDDHSQWLQEWLFFKRKYAHGVLVKTLV